MEGEFSACEQWIVRVRSVVVAAVAGPLPPGRRVRSGPSQHLRDIPLQLWEIIPPVEEGLLHHIRSLLQLLWNTIPPEDVGLLHHVRSLSYIADTRDGVMFVWSTLSMSSGATSCSSPFSSAAWATPHLRGL